MKQSSKDHAEGGAKQVAGKIKEAAGKLTNNQKLKDTGRADQVEGKVQRKVGDVKKVFGA